MLFESNSYAFYDSELLILLSKYIIWFAVGFGMGYVIPRFWRSIIMTLGSLFLLLIIVGYYDVNSIDWYGIQGDFINPILDPLNSGLQYFVKDLFSGAIYLLGFGIALKYPPKKKKASAKSS